MPKDQLSSEEELFRRQISEDHRPWGKFRVFPHEKASSLKIITVNPGASLSLQYHARRSEFWVVLDEGLEVSVGEKVWSPSKNEEIYIPRKFSHCVRNTGKNPARIMEVWLGESDEEDIVRLKDDYGRE